MPVLAPIVSFLAGVLGMALSGMVTRIITGLGIGVVTYVGANVVVTYMISEIVTSLQSLPAQLLQFAGLMKLDVALNIIFGAVTARLGLVTLDGTMRRFQFGPPGDTAVDGLGLPGTAPTGANLYGGALTTGGSGSTGGGGSGGGGSGPEL